MNVTELKTINPKCFETKYQEWRTHTLEYDWWDYVEAGFTDDCAALGVRVDDITFSGFWSQGDGAAFRGHVSVHKWMESQGHHLIYPAAYLACKNDGSYVRLETGRGNNMRANIHECANLTAPSGVFAGLEQTAWEELVDEQVSDLNIEAEVLAFCEELAAKLYETLESEYEYLTSEEMFIEHCEANDVTFEENEDVVCA